MAALDDEFYMGLFVAVSDRQWRDVLAIIRTQGLRFERDYLAANAPVFGVEDLLVKALAEG